MKAQFHLCLEAFVAVRALFLFFDAMIQYGECMMPKNPEKLELYLVVHRQSGVHGALKIIFKSTRNSEMEVKLHAFATQCPNVS